MTLYNLINKNLTEQRKAKNSVAVTVISTIKGELQRISDGKPENLSDAEIVKKLRSMVESIEETIKHAGVSDKLIEEREIINCYLPQMMSEQEIKDCIDAFVYDLGDNPKPQDIGKIMKSLKQFSSVMDMKIASSYVKEKLQ